MHGHFNYRFLIITSLVTAMGGYLFGFDFAVICLLGFVFIYKKLPETKGKSLEEVEEAVMGREE